ncbi:MAG TPA: contact-dependent growth inhibition system immunity protein [Polyangiales bacterium]|nr:contact-dependent growth inhibition system immunity protein [Polyangiales bacterium]
MLTSDPYPYLDHLLGGFFHQDAYELGHNDAEIVREFRAHARDYELLGLRADILRYLHLHDDDSQLLKSFNRMFAPSVSIGANDAEARAWLGRVLLLLA